jgi:HK97 family phage major capsid protein
MANTRIQDIINPEVLGDQVGAKYPDMMVLGNTNLVAKDGQFPIGTPGTEFKIPFWKRIGNFATLAENTPMVPTGVTTGAEYATVLRAGAAYEVLDTADLVSIADPMAEISSQIAKKAAFHLDAALVVRANLTPNAYDTSAVGAGTLTVDALITGIINNLGDNHQVLMAGGGIIMHSKPYGDLLKLGLIQNQYQAGMDSVKSGMIPYLLGMPVIVSDRVTTETISSVVHYNTYMVGAGALGLFFQRDVRVEFDRDMLNQSDLVAATVHFAPHLFGYDSKTSAVVAEDLKSIHLVKIKSK